MGDGTGHGTVAPTDAAAQQVRLRCLELVAGQFGDRLLPHVTVIGARDYERYVLGAEAPTGGAKSVAAPATPGGLMLVKGFLLACGAGSTLEADAAHVCAKLAATLPEDRWPELLRLIRTVGGPSLRTADDLEVLISKLAVPFSGPPCLRGNHSAQSTAEPS